MSFLGNIGKALNPFDSGGPDDKGKVGGEAAIPVVNSFDQTDIQRGKQGVIDATKQSANFANAVQGQALGQGLGTQTTAGAQQAGLNTGALANMQGSSLAGQGGAGLGALQNQLAGAGGVGNQMNAMNSINGLNNQLGGLNGAANLGSAFAQMQALANGQGPNPAQMALNNATGNNMQQQAALMASQRGAGQNAGLLARQAAMQGSNIQQQAAGQGALMQAQQQLGAMGQLGNLANSQIAAQQAQQGMALNGANNQIGQQLQAGQAATNAGLGQLSAQQAGVNQAFGQGSQLVGQGQNAVNANTAAQQGQLNSLSQGIASQNNANINAQGGQNDISKMEAANKQAATGKFYSAAGAGMMAGGSSGGGGMQTTSMGGTGAGEGINPASAVMTANHGGMVPRMADGGEVPEPMNVGAVNSAGFFGAPQLSPAQQFFNAAAQSYAKVGAPQYSGTTPNMGAPHYADGGAVQPENAPKSSYARMMAASATPIKKENYTAMNKGGKVPAMVSPGEGYLGPKQVQQVEKGKDPIQAAKVIPGKAKVKGDSLKNDTVPKTLDEGGIVLPRSVMESKHPHWAAHKFVSALMAQHGLKRK